MDRCVAGQPPWKEGRSAIPTIPVPPLPPIIPCDHRLSDTHSLRNFDVALANFANHVQLRLRQRHNRVPNFHTVYDCPSKEGREMSLAWDLSYTHCAQEARISIDLADFADALSHRRRNTCWRRTMVVEQCFAELDKRLPRLSSRGAEQLEKHEQAVRGP